MPTIPAILWVALGGSLGSVTRYIIQKGLAGAIGSSFPYGTFIVNLGGCLLIGWLFQYTERHPPFAEQIRLFLMTGICGGFTTFSAFTLESMTLLQAQRWGAFLLYAAASVLLGLVATYGGYLLGKTLHTP